MLIVRIHNDGTGTERSANYDYEVLVNHTCIDAGHVEGHDRADDWTALLARVIHHARYRNVVTEPPG